jgi:hypothetical protein
MYVENASGKSTWKKGRKIHTKKYKNNFVKERKKERISPLSQIANCSDIQVKGQQAH